MNIDERIEALTRFVKSMVRMRRDADVATDKQLAQIAQAFEATRDSIVRLERIAVARLDSRS